MQRTPDYIVLDSIVAQLKSVSPLILNVEDLRVWSISLNGPVIVTCKLKFDQRYTLTESKLSEIFTEAKLKLLDKNIKCLTLEPDFTGAHPKTSK